MRETVVFAGGCFWGVQYYFDQVPGVLSTTAGYTGGDISSPTYEQVCTGETGHTEAVQVEYDPRTVSFIDLLKHFFLIHDPTRADGQGFDIGPNYRPAIFYTTENQKKIIDEYVKELEKAKTYKKPIVTEVLQASEFWPAEGYHQKYAERTGRGVCHVPYSPLA